MRIIFFGTPDFAIPTLRTLLDNGYTVPAVITAPDKPGGRHGMIESAVKKFALERGLLVLQPEKLRNPLFLDQLRSLEADLQVVVAFRMLPEVVWAMPRFGTMNLHGSLLPKYRGAAPINWAIIRGEKETGVTTFLLQHEIDTGDILLQRSMEIGPDEDAGSVHDRMMELGAQVVLETVKNIEQNNVTTTPQGSLIPTFAPKLNLEVCKIDFHQPAEQVHNFIRGLSPYPGAWTMLDGKVLKVLRSKISDDSTKFESIAEYYSDGKSRLIISTLDGFIDVLELQIEGKKRTDVKSFLNGYKKSWKNIG